MATRCSRTLPASRPRRNGFTRFRAAAIKGWRYALAHPEEIADLILAKYSRRHERAHLFRGQ